MNTTHDKIYCIVVVKKEVDKL